MEDLILNKNEFIIEVSKRSGLSTYAIEEIFNVSFNLVVEKLIYNEEVPLPKIGVFEINRKNGMNLFGANSNKSQVCRYPIFKISNSLKTRVKNGFKYQK